MPIADIVRREIELALARKIPSAFSPRSQVIHEWIISGVNEIDNLLDGGLPVGAITELVGVEGSGRTTITLAYAAATAREGKVVAWVDVGDSFNPSSAAMNGVELERLLWIRCKQDESKALQNVRAQVVEPSQRPISFIRGGGSPHPRSEAHGMPQAVNAILQAHGGLHDKQTHREKKIIGTPGAPNRVLAKSLSREEQVPTDRLPSRCDEQAMRSVMEGPKCIEPHLHRRKNGGEEKCIEVVTAFTRAGSRLKRSQSPWTPLDYALRATDLLLQAGGFSLIVLDLGGTPPRMSWRVPLATWFRYRSACERSRTSLLLVTQHPCARSSAELVVRLSAGDMLTEGNVLTGFTYRAEIQRQRFKHAESNIVSICSPPQGEKSGTWRGRTAWAV